MLGKSNSRSSTASASPTGEVFSTRLGAAGAKAGRSSTTKAETCRDTQTRRKFSFALARCKRSGGGMRRKLIGPPETPDGKEMRRNRVLIYGVNYTEEKVDALSRQMLFSPYRFGASGLESKHRQNKKIKKFKPPCRRWRCLDSALMTSASKFWK